MCSRPVPRSEFLAMTPLPTHRVLLSAWNTVHSYAQIRTCQLPALRAQMSATAAMPSVQKQSSAPLARNLVAVVCAPRHAVGTALNTVAATGKSVCIDTNASAHRFHLRSRWGLLHRGHLHPQAIHLLQFGSILANLLTQQCFGSSEPQLEQCQQAALL